MVHQTPMRQNCHLSHYHPKYSSYWSSSTVLADYFRLQLGMVVLFSDATFFLCCFSVSVIVLRFRASNSRKLEDSSMMLEVKTIKRVMRWLLTAISVEQTLPFVFLCFFLFLLFFGFLIQPFWRDRVIEKEREKEGKKKEKKGKECEREPDNSKQFEVHQCCSVVAL